MPIRARRRREIREVYERAYTGVLRILPPEPGKKTSATVPDGVHVIPLTSDVVTVGRGLHNTVVLSEATVSREQAHLHLSGDVWRVTNVSRGRTLHVGAREVGPGESSEIAPGEIIAVSGVGLELVAPRASTKPLDVANLAWASARSDTHVLAPGVTLQFALRSRRDARLWWLLAALVLFLCCASAVVALGAAVLVGRHALATGGIGQALAATTVPLVPVLGAGALTLFLDRYERESLIVLCAAFVWGAIIAIPPVVGVEHLILRGILGAEASGAARTYAQAGIQAMVAGLAEESFKGVGLLALIAVVRDEFDNVTDGVLYGLLIGAGFALAENFAYFALTPRADLGFLVLGRVLLGWLSHSTFTALLGAGLGYARERGRVSRRWQAPLLGFAAACLLHFLFDFVVFASDVAANGAFATRFPAPFIALALFAAYGPLFVAQSFLLRITLGALQREAEVVREYLDVEVLSGQLTPEEYVLAQDASLRNRAERAILTRRGARAYLTIRALHQAMIGLAFRRWHVAQGDAAKPGVQQPEDAYRERIARLRGSLLRQLAPADAENQRVVGGGDAGDVIFGVSQDQQSAQGDEFLVQRVLDHADDRRGEIEPANRSLLDTQAQVPVDDGDERGG